MTQNNMFQFENLANKQNQKYWKLYLEISVIMPLFIFISRWVTLRSFIFQSPSGWPGFLKPSWKWISLGLGGGGAEGESEGCVGKGNISTWASSLLNVSFEASKKFFQEMSLA